MSPPPLPPWQQAVNTVHADVVHHSVRNTAMNIWPDAGGEDLSFFSLGETGSCLQLFFAETSREYVVADVLTHCIFVIIIIILHGIPLRAPPGFPARFAAAPWRAPGTTLLAGIRRESFFFLFFFFMETRLPVVGHHVPASVPLS